MRSITILASLIFVGACGSDPPKNNTQVDAPVSPMIDAAPSGLAGLGQKCGTGLPNCPANAPTCLTTTGATTGFCSAVCHMAATVMTNAMGQFGAPNTTPADDTKCTAVFTGTAGVAACDVPVNVMPAVMNPPQKNTTFTFDSFCGIDCGAANACPTGTTCNTQVMSCEPS